MVYHSICTKKMCSSCHWTWHRVPEDRLSFGQRFIAGRMYTRKIYKRTAAARTQTGISGLSGSTAWSLSSLDSFPVYRRCLILTCVLIVQRACKERLHDSLFMSRLLSKRHWNNPCEPNVDELAYICDDGEESADRRGQRSDGCRFLCKLIYAMSVMCVLLRRPVA